jgi:hypothetical protein
MKQYIKFYDNNSGIIEEFIYHPAISGEVELYPLTNSTSILRLYFRKLSALNKSIDIFEGSTELMLANFPVQIKDYDELDGFTIELKHGWYDAVSFTMLSLQDGEPVNNNIIEFIKNDNGSFTVSWKGEYTYYHSENGSKFELQAIAYPAVKVITPLCDYEDELKIIFSEKTIEDFIPYDYDSLNFDEDDN